MPNSLIAYDVCVQWFERRTGHQIWPFQLKCTIQTVLPIFNITSIGISIKHVIVIAIVVNISRYRLFPFSDCSLRCRCAPFHVMPKEKCSVFCNRLQTIGSDASSLCWGNYFPFLIIIIIIIIKNNNNNNNNK